MSKRASEKTATTAKPAGFRDKWLPWALLAFFAAYIIGGFRPPKEKTEFNTHEFAQLPVVLNGRVQPLDSVAINSLLIIRGKASVALEPEGERGLFATFKSKRMSATEWLLEVASKPEQANERKIFRIDHPQLKGLLGFEDESEKHFSFNQIRAKGMELQKEAERAGKLEAQQRDPFDRAVIKLASALQIYMGLKNTFKPESSSDFAEEVALFEKHIPAGLEALKKNQAGEAHSEEDIQVLLTFFRRYDDLIERAYALIVPPDDPANKDGWENIGASLKSSMRDAKVDPAAKFYATMATAYAKDKPADFNAAVAGYKSWLQGKFDKELKKARNEVFFNDYKPFIKAIAVYLVAFLLACGFWFNFSPWLRRSAVMLLLLAIAVHTSGLIFRMFLEGRPPVTNLYSSAIFVGWGAAILGVFLERFFKDGIGAVTASAVGFLTLIIAHNLSLDGDTMIMLQAVLDTNFWLATHVVVITLGYASMFLAGFLAIVYVLRGVFTSGLTSITAKALARMVYGIVCFATLFSFVGTVLGGIWADQSWGRFWGWDPKENGALLIVIWCAVILHARWGGIIRERGLMAMAIAGNIVTGFSWFGVNMLGVGLHAYGFMDQAFKWLMAFNVSQVLLIALAYLPVQYWRSNPSGEPAKPKTAPEGPGPGAQPAYGK